MPIHGYITKVPRTPVENNQRETGYEIVHTAYYTKRSSGIFTHPAHAAYYLEYLLPLALAYLVTVRRAGYRLLFVTLLALGSIALYLTFSRSGLVDLPSVSLFFADSGMISRMSGRSVVHCIAVLAIALTATAPFLIYSFSARDTISKRFELMNEGLATFSRRPLFGAGLNNSSTVVEGSIRISTTGQRTRNTNSGHS